MSDYMISVFGICLVGGVCLMLAYGQGKGESAVVGIIILWIILAPVGESLIHFDLDVWLNSIPTSDYDEESQIGEVIEDAFAEGITRAVAEKFSLDEEKQIRLHRLSFCDNKSQRQAL